MLVLINTYNNDNNVINKYKIVSQLYWPHLECLTVHTTTRQAPHLSRYGSVIDLWSPIEVPGCTVAGLPVACPDSWGSWLVLWPPSWPRGITVRFRCRILDYGVAASFVLDRRVIEELRIVVDDEPEEPEQASKFSKDIYHFR